MARFSKGLQGVIAGQSEIGLVDGHNGVLAYRGYAIRDLAQKASYMETAYLLLNHKLPNQAELKTFSKILKNKRSLPQPFLEMIHLFPKEAHPMESLQTVVAALGMTYHDTPDQLSPQALKERCLELIAQFPTIVATCWRASQGEEIIPPRSDLAHPENFLHMISGQVPDKEGSRIFDACLTLHAEHSFNASTFSARVVSSSMASLHASVSAAVGSLYGPLHGGANERVLQMISEIKDVNETDDWVLKKLENKEKIMGMGHRVYEVKDPRSYVLEEMLSHYSKKKKDTQTFEILKKIESIMCREMEKKEKEIWPNVDFFSGALYRLLGIPERLFTPIFAIARVSGWCAHILEQLHDNRIYRPVCEYVGERDKKFIPLEKR